MQIPLLDLRREYEYMKKEIDQAMKNCLGHQTWILGSEVRELEKRISEYLGVKHCVGVSSGTDGLVLSLRALAIKLKGQEFFESIDEVITTPFTFTATGDAILRSGATPVFIDISPETFNIDAEKIKSYLSQLPAHSHKVVGVLPVHLYGQACDMDAILSIAQAHNLFIIEDAAQAFGGEWKNKKLGSLGATGVFSFFPSKNLGGFGDGGMVATNDDEIAELVRMLLKHGGKDKYNVDHIGYNARLDTIQAAVLLAKFKYVDEFNQKRRKIAAFYEENLSGIDSLSLPKEGVDAHSVFHQYTIRVLNGKRDQLQSYLQEKGISCVVYYPLCLHQMRVFKGRCKIFEKLENAERVTGEVLSLPVEPLLSEEELKEVVEKIRKFFWGKGKGL